MYRLRTSLLFGSLAVFSIAGSLAFALLLSGSMPPPWLAVALLAGLLVGGLGLLLTIDFP